MGSSDIAFWGDPTFGPKPPFHFKVKIHEDGSAWVHGEIHLPDADPPAVLVAIADSAEAMCADLDDDGDVGLSALTMQFKHPSTTDLVRFVVVPIGEDIDASGTYSVLIDLGEGAPETVEVEVRVTPDRRGGRPPRPTPAVNGEFLRRMSRDKARPEDVDLLWSQIVRAEDGGSRTLGEVDSSMRMRE